MTLIKCLISIVLHIYWINFYVTFYKRNQRNRWRTLLTAGYASLDVSLSFFCIKTTKLILRWFCFLAQQNYNFGQWILLCRRLSYRISEGKDTAVFLQYSFIRQLLRCCLAAAASFTCTCITRRKPWISIINICFGFLPF